LDLACSDPVKLKRFGRAYEVKFRTLDAVTDAWKSNPGFLSSQHETFLKSIHPRKPISAFMRFSQHIRPQIKAENPDAEFGDLGRMIGKAWKALADDEKSQYGFVSSSTEDDIEPEKPQRKRGKSQKEEEAPDEVVDGAEIANEAVNGASEDVVPVIEVGSETACA
jgi:hypothetical protein